MGDAATPRQRSSSATIGSDHELSAAAGPGIFGQSPNAVPNPFVGVDGKAGEFFLRPSKDPDRVAQERLFSISEKACSAGMASSADCVAKHDPVKRRPGGRPHPWNLPGTPVPPLRRKSDFSHRFSKNFLAAISITYRSQPAEPPATVLYLVIGG